MPRAAMGGESAERMERMILTHRVSCGSDGLAVLQPSLSLCQQLPCNVMDFLVLTPPRPGSHADITTPAAA